MSTLTVLPLPLVVVVAVLVVLPPESPPPQALNSVPAMPPASQRSTGGVVRIRPVAGRWAIGPFVILE